MSQENVEIVRRAFEAASEGDVGVWFQAADPEIRVYPPADEPDAADEYRGLDGLMDYLTNGTASGTSMRWSPVEFADAGKHVLVQVRECGRVERTGVEVEEVFSHSFVLRDGKTVEWHMYDSHAEALEAVGRRRGHRRAGVELMAAEVGSCDIAYSGDEIAIPPPTLAERLAQIEVPHSGIGNQSSSATSSSSGRSSNRRRTFSASLSGGASSRSSASIAASCAWVPRAPDGAELETSSSSPRSSSLPIGDASPISTTQQRRGPWTGRGRPTALDGRPSD